MNEVQQPNWNSADLNESLHKQAIFLHGMAREMFLKDGTHVELVFVFNEDGLMGTIPVEGESREEFQAQLKDYLKDEEIVGVVHIVEAWTRPLSSDHITKQLRCGEMKLSELRPQDRQESLITCAMGRDKSVRTWVDAIIRSGETVTLGDSMDISGGEGTLKGFFNEQD